MMPLAFPLLYDFFNGLIQLADVFVSMVTIYRFGICMHFIVYIYVVVFLLFFLV